MEVIGMSDADSDRDDDDAETKLGNWLDQLEMLKEGLDDDGTATVKRRPRTVVTPEMALESFRYSFLNENPENVSLDAILGELTELEQQLTAQCDYSHTLVRGDHSHHLKDVCRDSGNDLSHQSDLDSLSYDLLNSSNYHRSRDFAAYDVGETDSAFSDNTSLPSSGSYTSMVTVSSSADTTSSGEASSTNGSHATHPQLFYRSVQDEQKSRLKDEKIRNALEKIKDGNFKKLFVRAYTVDGSSKSILVDETMTVGHICSMLAEKNHDKLMLKSSVIEQLPDLHMERTLEDHDSLVENMVFWSHDSTNRVLYDNRSEKYEVFVKPEKYLLPSYSEQTSRLDDESRSSLIQDYFCGSDVKVPEVEGPLYIKADGKKSWKKFYCVLRSSGLFYNPKGKMTKSTKDLTCLAQFDYIDIYRGLNWKKKYGSPTDYTFALKHPQIQKKTSKYIRYLCTESQETLDSWITGLRIAKHGKQLHQNYEARQLEVAAWDIRDRWANESADGSITDSDWSLNGSRLSLPIDGDHNSYMSNCSDSPLRSSTTTLIGDSQDDCAEITQNGGLYVANNAIDAAAHKTPVKRVSFSTTNSIINTDENCPRHRDSITSSSTDTSDESTSSAESRGSQVRKLRAKLPLTTGTKRLVSEMCQNASENSSMSSIDGTLVERKPLAQNTALRISQRRKSAPTLDIPSQEGAAGDRSRRQCGSPMKQQSYVYDIHSRTTVNSYTRDFVDGAVTPTNQNSEDSFVMTMSPAGFYKMETTAPWLDDSSGGRPNESYKQTSAARAPVQPHSIYQSVHKPGASRDNDPSSSGQRSAARQSYQQHRKSLSSSAVPQSHDATVDASSLYSEVNRASATPPPLPPNHPTMSHHQLLTGPSSLYSVTPSITHPHLSTPAPTGSHPPAVLPKPTHRDSTHQQPPVPPPHPAMMHQPSLANNQLYDSYRNVMTHQLPSSVTHRPLSMTPPPSPVIYHSHSPQLPPPPPPAPSTHNLPPPAAAPHLHNQPTPPTHHQPHTHNLSRPQVPPPPAPPHHNQPGPPPPPPTHSLPPPTAAKPVKASLNGPPITITPLNLNSDMQHHNKSPPVIAPKPLKRDPIFETPQKFAPPTPSPDYNINSPLDFTATRQVNVEYGIPGPLPFITELEHKQNDPDNIYSNIEEETASRRSLITTKNQEATMTIHEALPMVFKKPDDEIHGAEPNGLIYASVPKTPVKPDVSSEMPIYSAVKMTSSPKPSLPPAPPRRSETTRLSMRGTRPQLTKSDSCSSSDSAVSKESANSKESAAASKDGVVPKETTIEPFVEFDGIMSIEDLPPPPPELLAGLTIEDAGVSCPDRSSKGVPPPPPKRSKDTHLSANIAPNS